MFFNGLFAFFGLIVKVGLRLCCVLVQILTFGLIRCHVDIVKILPLLFLCSSKECILNFRKCFFE
jgi:hypothetical protein